MIDRRTFLRSTAGAATLGGMGIMPIPSAAALPVKVVEVDPILAGIEAHKLARDAFELATKGASDDYLDSEDYDAIDCDERVAWLSLIETQSTTSQGLAAFAAHVLHTPALSCDVREMRQILATIAIAAAKFAYTGAST